MQLIIFGSGRWAFEICKEAIRFTYLSKIILITNNKEAKRKFAIFKKKISFCKYLS